MENQEVMTQNPSEGGVIKGKGYRKLLGLLLFVLFVGVLLATGVPWEEIKDSWELFLSVFGPYFVAAGAENLSGGRALQALLTGEVSK